LKLRDLNEAEGNTSGVGMFAATPNLGRMIANEHAKPTSSVSRPGHLIFYFIHQV